MAKKNYVLDTSVYLTDAESIFKFDNHDIFIPLKVLEEVDKHKKRQDSVGSNARKIIRILDEFRERGNLETGIRIEKGKGILKVMSYQCLKDAVFPPDLDVRIPDHAIIATATAVRANNPNRKTIIVSRDINMRVISDSIGLLSEDYITDKAVRSSEELYQGFTEYLIDDAAIDQFYNDEEVRLDPDEITEELFLNEYLLLVSNANPKKTALACFQGHHLPLKKIIHSDIKDWNIKSRNKGLQ